MTKPAKVTNGTSTTSSQQSRLPVEEDDTSSSDICPVCKSSRYLNPNMRFLLNPECYHKMCESCVDRIFSHGPAPCPVAGCHRTLRKQRFRKQTFEDMCVEKEVDIRKRVGKIFNRREEEFATLKDYNDYLEEVETITFNLLNNIEVAATEAKLASYAKANADIINHNISIEQQEIADQETHRAAEREQARIRRETARREDEEDRQMLKEGRREVIDLLAKTSSADSSTAEKIARQGQQKILLKRSSAARHRTQQQQHQISASDDSQAMPTFQFKGLKPPPKPRIHDLNQTPYDPFMGLRHLNTPDYFILRKPNNDDDENNNGHYEHPWLERARSDQSILAGGYDLREYYTRCLTEAYEGLGVFLEEEVGGRRERGKGSISTGALDDSLEGNGDTS